MARRFAVVISHETGLSGTPVAGHCSRAATRASCAKSSDLTEIVGTPEVIDGAPLCGSHQPRDRVVWDAGGGPLFEGGDEGVLRQVLRSDGDCRHAGSDRWRAALR